MQDKDRPASTGETSQTLDRGLQVLDLLARGEAGQGMTITELASQIGVGRAVVYRLVTTLETHDLVTRRSDGRVRLSVGVARLAAAARPILLSAATPVLRQLADMLGATAHLTVAEGDEAIAVVVSPPSWPDYHVGYRAGARHPLERGAAGRAILAAREQDAGSSLRLARPTGAPAQGGVSTRPDSDEPRPVVQTVGELQPGAYGAAVALPAGCLVEASVGVVALEPLPEDNLETLLRDAAEEIAQRLA